MARLVIGTRGSPLALWQATHVRRLLMERHPGLEVVLEIIKTRGDKVLDKPLYHMLEKSMFTKEIQDALLTRSIDLAVHSLKDLPTDPVEGLTLAAVSVREDPADALVTKRGSGLADLAPGAKVMSGSLRRQAQLLHLRPDVQVVPVRGNVGTRMHNFEDSDAQAILFALAGLLRLDLAGRVAARLDPRDFLPACGQGALGLEIRSDDSQCAALVKVLDDPPSRAATTAERAFLNALGGGCQIPVGAYARFDAGRFVITGMAATLDGAKLLTRTVEIPAPDLAAATDVSASFTAAAELGSRLAQQILADGGREILDQIRLTPHLPPPEGP